MLTLKKTFALKNSLAELDVLCHHLEGFCDKLGVSKKCAFEIHLIMEELFTNIVSYGLSKGAESQISVLLTCAKEMLTIRITDKGTPFNPLAACSPDVTCCLENREIGGLGIHFAKKYATDIQYKRSGQKNILTIKKAINKD